MDIVISHISALQVLRRTRRGALLPAAQTTLPSRMPTVDEARELARVCPCLAETDRAPEVLVAGASSCHVSTAACARVWTGPLPEGALVELSPGIRCVSPAFLPVLLTPYLGPWELRLLLAELMGLYSVAPGSEFGLLQRDEPLITKDELLAFLDSLGSARGTKIVRAALAQAPELAASPQEAKLYLRATLSRPRGGYGMKDVVLNSAFELRRISSRMKTLQVRKPDLLFIGPHGTGACLDYMGAWHDTDQRAGLDARRRNELLANGFKPYEIFKANYDDLDYMDGLMRAIRDDLGMAPPHHGRQKQEHYRRARYRLWRELERVDTSFLNTDGSL